MIIDGKALALVIKDELKKQVLASGKKLKLAVVMVGDNQSSIRYVAKKKQFGEDIGVGVDVLQYPLSLNEDDLLKKIADLADNPQVSGLVIQLPLPAHINTETILKTVPVDKDVDALNPESKIMSPVARAVETILEHYQIKVAGKKSVVVGHGKLVGQPLASWLKTKKSEVQILDSRTADIKPITATADILILGAGSPHFLKPDMIKEGVVLIDAGTSEADSKLLGDADPACAVKCSLFTPVPGGVGPLTVAMLFKNLLTLANN